MVAPPERSLLEIDEMKALIAANPSTGKEDHIRLLGRLVDQFGAAGGVLAWNIFFWTGRSTKLEGGWLFKSREQFKRETGLGIREFSKAREILRGERAWAGRTVRVLDESRPSRRTPAHYRLRLEDLAAALGVELRQPSTAGPDLPPNAESSRGTTDSSRRTTDSSRGTASVSTNRENGQRDFVLRTSEPGSLTPADEEKTEDEGNAGDVEHDHQTPPGPASSPEPLSKPMLNEVLPLLLREDADTLPRRLALAHVRGVLVDGSRVTAEHVAAAVQVLLGGDLPAAALLEAVRRGLEELRLELGHAA